MATHTLEEYEPGKWRLIIKRDRSGGILTTTLEWDHKPSDEVVQFALDDPVLERKDYEARPGDSLFLKRVGPFLIGKDVSGPIWKFPKLHLDKWSVHIGWRYTAYWISVSEGKKNG